MQASKSSSKSKRQTCNEAPSTWHPAGVSTEQSDFAGAALIARSGSERAATNIYVRLRRSALESRIALPAPTRHRRDAVPLVELGSVRPPAFRVSAAHD